MTGLSPRQGDRPFWLNSLFRIAPEDVLLDFVDEDGVAGTNESVLVQRYLHGPAVDQVLAQDDGNGNVLWHLIDHLGTVRDLVDNSGAVVNHLTYDSFGNVIDETDSTFDSRYLYTGREFDEEIELYYYRARYYNATTGRFLSEDPIGFAGLDTNLFRYVGNTVINFRDPSGLISVLIPGDPGVPDPLKDSKGPSTNLDFTNPPGQGTDGAPCKIERIQRADRDLPGFEIPLPDTSIPATKSLGNTLRKLPNIMSG